MIRYDQRAALPSRCPTTPSRRRRAPPAVGRAQNADELRASSRRAAPTETRQGLQVFAKTAASSSGRDRRSRTGTTRWSSSGERCCARRSGARARRGDRVDGPDTSLPRQSGPFGRVIGDPGRRVRRLPARRGHRRPRPARRGVRRALRGARRADGVADFDDLLVWARDLLRDPRGPRTTSTAATTAC